MRKLKSDPGLIGERVQQQYEIALEPAASDVGDRQHADCLIIDPQRDAEHRAVFGLDESSVSLGRMGDPWISQEVVGRDRTSSHHGKISERRPAQRIGGVTCARFERQSRRPVLHPVQDRSPRPT
jgi:hypothetical protein